MSASSDTPSSKILYSLQDRLPPAQAMAVAFQQLLAMLGGCVTAPLIAASVVGLSAEDTAYVINMSLFASGIGTLIQVRTIGPLGSGLLTITGTSFSFIGPLIAAGQAGGLPMMLGMALVGAPVQMILSPILPKLRTVFSPLVSGIVVLLIGISLIPTSMRNIAAGLPLQEGQAEWLHLVVAAVVVLVVLVFNGLNRPWARMSAVIIGLISGILLCSTLGVLAWDGGASGGWFTAPVPFKYGLAFSWELLPTFLFIYLVTTVESIGDLTATSSISGEPTTGDTYWKRVKGGVFADGFNSALAACLNTFPNTTFSQNNGVIQLTGVASRQIGLIAGGYLILLGLIPAIGSLAAALPQPVMGGLTLVLFGLIASAGIRILHNAQLDQRGLVILATSLGMGVGVSAAPQVLEPLPDFAKSLLSSGISTGGLTALILNAVMPRHGDKKADDTHA
ncbi:MAG: purine permease [Opitutales bacterium]|nr:purine permease [Opitutales bacterium]